MKNQVTASFPPPGIRHSAFSLIEMIGVLAIIAIAAAVLIPALIKEADKLVADQESASLQSFGAALQNNIMRTRRIPADGSGPDWATNIAAEAGLNLAAVANNFRGQPRIFLIDTQGFGTLTLPYRQPSSGIAANPPSPRFMLLSSLGKPLPAALTSRPSTTDFTNLWNSTPAAFPGTIAGSTWSGDPRDVTIQRISLSPLFVRLLLNTNNNTVSAYYAVDQALGNTITLVSNLNAYYLQNSILSLYTTNSSTLDSQQILTRDISFVYDQNAWRDTITSVSISTTNPPDYSSIINAFLNAGPAGATPSPSQIVVDLNNYMIAYDNWSTAGFPYGATAATRTNVLNAYTSMMSDVNGLVQYVKP